MFDFVIYKMDKYFTEMKTMIFELRYGNVDDRPVPYENDAHDLWLFE